MPNEGSVSYIPSTVAWIQWQVKQIAGTAERMRALRLKSQYNSFQVNYNFRFSPRERPLDSVHRAKLTIPVYRPANTHTPGEK